MKIIYYDEKHLAECANLFMAHYNHVDLGCNFTKEKAMFYLQELIFKPRFVGLLVFEKKQLVGFAFSHLKTWCDKDSMHINELIIKDDYQKQGIATKLLTFIESYAKNYNLAGITTTTNILPLTQFYQKNDFLDHDVTFLFKGVTKPD